VISGLLKSAGYNSYPCTRAWYPYLCPGIGGYMGTDLRRVGHLFFWKKPVVSVPVYPPPVPVHTYPRICICRSVKFKFQKFPPRFTSNQYPYSYPSKKKQKHKKNTLVPVPVVSETGTGMKRVGYNFEKKNRLPVSAVPAARRGRTRPIPAVPVSKPLVVMMGKKRVRGVQSG
jgi:hypothetical protein